MLATRLPEPLTKKEGEKKEDTRMSVAESRGISKESEKLVARIWREVEVFFFFFFFFFINE